MKLYTIIEPAEVTDELLWSMRDKANDIRPVNLLGGAWQIATGALPGAYAPSPQREDESDESYVARIYPAVKAQFDAGLPDGILVTSKTLNLLKAHPDWIAAEPE